MKLKISLLLFCLWTVLLPSAFAGTVTQVKGGRVVVDFSGESVNVGDQFYILTSENKKIAVIKLAVVKNGKAVGDIIKGKALVGATTMSRNSAGASAGSAAQTSDLVKVRQDQMKMGVHFKYMMNTISAKQQDGEVTPNQETVSMKGSNFGVAGSIDYPLFDWIKAYGMVSYEILDIGGTGQFLSCDGKSSTDCNVKVNYLGFQGLARYDILKTKYNVWAGLGLEIRIPMTKKSTALNTDGLKQSDSFVAAVGMDYHINNKFYVPIGFEYHYSMNTSNEVPVIDQMNLLIGYGKKF
jgi:hypothetical protein